MKFNLIYQITINMPITYDSMFQQLFYKFAMIQSKNRKSTVKNSISKSPYPNTSSTKEKSRQMPAFKQRHQTATKNLMDDFTAVQKVNAESKLNEDSNIAGSCSVNNQSLSIYASSIQQEGKSIQQESKFMTENISDNYKINLPKSYILAMTGLQEAVKYRQSQIHKLKRQLRQCNSEYQQCLSDKKAGQFRIHQLDREIQKYSSEIAFLKETILDLRSQIAQNIKKQVFLQNQLKKAKQASESNSKNQQQLIENLRKQLSSATERNQNMKDELKHRKYDNEDLKKELVSILARQAQTNARNESKLQKISQQLSKEILNHQLNKDQIAVLKKQVQILSHETAAKENILAAEKAKVTDIQKELEINKRILQEVTLEQESLKNMRSTIEVKNMNTSERHERSWSKAGQSRSSTKQRTENRQEDRQLISQMRELMRMEKELVSLNYQLELIEKEMVNIKDQQKRQESRARYAALHKEISKKSLQIREQKDFLQQVTKNPLR